MSQLTELSSDLSYHDESTGTPILTLVEISACEALYEKAECKDKTQLIITMAIGLTINGLVLFDKMTVDSDMLPSMNRKAWKPNAASCTNKIERSKLQMKEKIAPYNESRWTIPKKYD